MKNLFKFTCLCLMTLCCLTAVFLPQLTSATARTTHRTVHWTAAPNHAFVATPTAWIVHRSHKTVLPGATHLMNVYMTPIAENPTLVVSIKTEPPDYITAARLTNQLNMVSKDKRT